VSKRWNVAVVGALGMVGTEMIQTLERRNFPVAELRPLDLPKLAGRTVEFNGESIDVRGATADNFKDIDIAIFSAGSDASLQLAPEAVQRGAIVVDNSAAWRMDPKCPLVVPEVNPNDLKWHNGIIANPNCSTIQMVVALKPIHDKAKIQRIVVSTYQATSGAGKTGVTDLESQIRAWCSDTVVPEAKAFPLPIAFNVIPQIDVFQEGGYTKEEYKMVNETRKILGDPLIRVTATCVRVPVFFGHSEAVNIQTAEKIHPEEVRDLLRRAAGIVVIDDPVNKKYPAPLMTQHTDEVYVGRIREDNTIKNGLNLWIVSDNIRKGAALNAVQIAEKLVEMNLIGINKAEVFGTSSR
jgi:aspartate-semialdehyde dehydrogenase